MDIKDSLRMMLAAALPNVNVDDQAFDYNMAAIFLRYEKICEPILRAAIDGHVLDLVTKDKARLARDSYNETYLLSLNLPYSGIQMLCTELVRIFKKFNLTPSDVQLRFAAGKFDWKNEYETLLHINSL